MQDAEVVDMEENYARVSLSICLSQHCGRSFLSSPPVKFDLLTGSSDGQSTDIRIFLKFIDCTEVQIPVQGTGFPRSLHLWKYFEIRKKYIIIFQAWKS